MGKLLKLLNEYEESKKSDKLIGQEYYFVEEKELARGHIVWYDPTTNEHLLSWVPFESVVCSKSYWFIERLVIYAKVKYWPIEELTIIDKDWRMYWYTDTLLMLLSIQDDPISFLISVLK